MIINVPLVSTLPLGLGFTLMLWLSFSVAWKTPAWIAKLLFTDAGHLYANLLESFLCCIADIVLAAYVCGSNGAIPLSIIVLTGATSFAAVYAFTSYKEYYGLTIIAEYYFYVAAIASMYTACLSMALCILDFRDTFKNDDE